MRKDNVALSNVGESIAISFVNLEEELQIMKVIKTVANDPEDNDDVRIIIDGCFIFVIDSGSESPTSYKDIVPIFNDHLETFDVSNNSLIDTRCDKNIVSEKDVIE